MTDFTILREYLADFFTEFSYDSADAAVLTDAFDRIVARPEAAALLHDCLAAYDADFETDYNDILAKSAEMAQMLRISPFTTDLVVFILMSHRLRELYDERGLPRETWHLSMCDLKYKLDECKAVKGIVGSFVANWFPGFFRLIMFGLGRLQFEVITFGRDFSQLKNGDRVINIHIPRDGTPLDAASCADAYAKAKEWFRGQATDFDGKVAFHCDSWLLYPGILPALKDTSNVKRFAGSFDVYDVHEYFDGHNLWRLFDTDEKNPARLPADSSLRRAYVDRMKAGLPQGSGRGVFFY